ncbi:glycoside hydrolase family 9 protein [Algoriphagus sp.]|uniref:glycoside hydrolase family 9 protein n=1 Tax=Algoriphagus sp. TaxID=1872435 RepID=UPI00271694C1|nr:glycoside hydrolase family 9 protein [Algoriphagus sp.]MDO8968188.1 glycoside hydrolase family 9 protein [Algoriphagus sp.]MDP3202289.1 glycoside hydrolase family 9 protein [Algoriphagus sp.]
MYIKSLLIFIIGSLWTGCAVSQNLASLEVNESIRLNQIGYLPEQHKVAIVLSESPVTRFFILDTTSDKVVFEGVSVKNQTKTLSGKTAWKLDFTAFTAEGKYEIGIPDFGKSHPFKIDDQVYSELGKASLKAFYFQRASVDLPEEYAGIWARKGGHPDNLVKIHPSAASQSRPEGMTLSSAKGWYDAGDYNKYIVNGGITVGTLLSLYENYPKYFAELNLTIPESQNSIPDILDEVLWNLDWMLTMQDPADGGVYHKLTTAKFEGMVEPHLAVNQRYFVQKSTAATLDFAAVMAQAYRIYKPFTPENAEVYLKAAKKAWKWASENPELYYRQNEMNETFDPDVVTGAYGDQNLSDEWIWAAAEMYISIQDLEYWEILKEADLKYQLPSWSQVKWLGFYSLIRNEKSIPQIPEAWMSTLKNNLIAMADSYDLAGQKQVFLAPMGADPKDFIWGSNAVASNQGILLLEAFKLSGKAEYLQSAKGNLDYILGRNATGFSYVTGFGNKTPMYPHHRLATSRPDLPPLPGFMVGGPNPSQQDKCDYPSDFPDESYTDLSCSYASNEIAINWSAAFAFLVNAILANQTKIP